MLVVVSAIEKDSIDSAKCVCLSDVSFIKEDKGIIIVFNSLTAIQKKQLKLYIKLILHI